MVLGQPSNLDWQWSSVTYPVEFNDWAMLAISDHGDVNDFAEVVFLKGECVNRIKDMTEYENFNEIEWKRKMETSFLETHKGTLNEESINPLIELMSRSEVRNAALSSTTRSMRGIHEEYSLEKE